MPLRRPISNDQNDNASSPPPGKRQPMPTMAMDSECDGADIGGNTFRDWLPGMRRFYLACRPMSIAINRPHDLTIAGRRNTSAMNPTPSVNANKAPNHPDGLYSDRSSTAKPQELATAVTSAAPPSMAPALSAASSIVAPCASSYRKRCKK